MDLPKVEPGLCSETCLASCDGNQNVHTKVEEVPDIKSEENSKPITFPVVKCENEVSFVGVCVCPQCRNM
jgi:hypothetical protein